MNNKLRIGQMAKLHNIPIKTLRYYDEIDLFKPIDVDKETGYRYYSTEQFEKLNTINYLKVLGLSLKEIKVLLEVRDKDYFVWQLEKHQALVNNQIRELKEIRKAIDYRIEEVKRASDISKIGWVMIREIGERKAFLLKQVINSENELEIALRSLENRLGRNSTVFIGKVGLIMAQSNIQKHKFQEYSSIFIWDESDTQEHELVTVFPKGQYACIYFRGRHEESDVYYEKVLSYLDKNNFKITGDAIERTIINEYISNNQDDYLTEIQLPVKKT